ncbi:MAG: flippase-like domain-containing protein [Planctomycetota bacterium]|nr:flippase-like domain-containing protein [Planctomycetota bacterium]
MNANEPFSRRDDGSGPDGRNKRIWLNIGQAAVTIAVMAFLFQRMDKALLFAALDNLTPAVIAVSLALLFLLNAVCFLRWRVFLEILSLPAPAFLLIRFNIIGFFFNQLLPTGLGGDAVKGWLLHRTAGLPGSEVAISVLADRLAGLFWLSLFTTAGAPFFVQASGDVLLNFLVRLASLIPFCFFGAYFVIRRLAEKAGFWREKMAFVRRLNEVAALSCRSLRHVLAVMAVSVVNQMALIGIFWLIGRDIGLGLSFGRCFLIVPLAILFSMLPVSLGGWGVRETVFASLAKALGGDLEPAVLTSALYGLVQMAASLPGAAVWLFHKNDPGGDSGKVGD